ncbi:hypothetical protein [Plantibacter sp. YIM 135249]|uniref:hypothetical protein n=1 Tax=Plantibacter sp. YIM 135249 TaxID=3423918 RepID=UPI003D32F32C
MSISISPKNKKKPLKVNYDGVAYKLPGAIPIEILSVQNTVPRPKVMAGSQKDSYESQVGVAILGVFVERVLPEDFRAALDLDDLDAVFEAWAEHTGLGKSQPSTGSSKRTKTNSSSKQSAEDSE